MNSEKSYPSPRESRKRARSEKSRSPDKSARDSQGDRLSRRSSPSRSPRRKSSRRSRQRSRSKSSSRHCLPKNPPGSSASSQSSTIQRSPTATPARTNPTAPTVQQRLWQEALKEVSDDECLKLLRECIVLSFGQIKCCFCHKIIAIVCVKDLKQDVVMMIQMALCHVDNDESHQRLLDWRQKNLLVQSFAWPTASNARELIGHSTVFSWAESVDAINDQFTRLDEGSKDNQRPTTQAEQLHVTYHCYSCKTVLRSGNKGINFHITSTRHHKNLEDPLGKKLDYYCKSCLVLDDNKNNHDAKAFHRSVVNELATYGLEPIEEPEVIPQLEKVPYRFSNAAHYALCFKELLREEVRKQKDILATNQLQDLVVEWQGEGRDGNKPQMLFFVPEEAGRKLRLRVGDGMVVSCVVGHKLYTKRATVTKMPDARDERVCLMLNNSLGIISFRTTVSGWSARKIFDATTFHRMKVALIELEKTAIEASNDPAEINFLRLLFNREGTVLTKLYMDDDVQRRQRVLDHSDSSTIKLTPIQRKAVDMVFEYPLVLVDGPTGTGKTQTIVAMVEQLTKNEEESQVRPSVLVCAPSNAATDLLATRLHEAGITAMRINSTYRELELLRAHPITDEQDEQSEKIEAHQLSLARKAIKSDQALTVEVFEDWLRATAADRQNNVELKTFQVKFIYACRNILSTAKVSCATCITAGSDYFKLLMNELKYDLLIIDEAAQATETECLVPMYTAISRRRVVLVGDRMQQGPMVQSEYGRSAGMGRSMFQRLLEDVDAVTKVYLGHQFRSNPFIAEFSKRHFYNGKVQHGVDECQRRLVPKWSDERYRPDPDNTPLVFYDIVNGKEDRVDSSYSNEAEAEIAVDLLLMLIEDEDVDPAEVCVITLYDAQRQLLLRMIEAREMMQESRDKLKRTRIADVSGIQGYEYKVVIITFVRSHDIPKGHTECPIGHLEDERRLNHALTRAKCLLLLIGNAKTLRTHSELYDALVRYVERFGNLIRIVYKPRREHKKKACPVN